MRHRAISSKNISNIFANFLIVAAVTITSTVYAQGGDQLTRWDKVAVVWDSDVPAFSIISGGKKYSALQVAQILDLVNWDRERNLGSRGRPSCCYNHITFLDDAGIQYAAAIEEPEKTEDAIFHIEKIDIPKAKALSAEYREENPFTGSMKTAADSLEYGDKLEEYLISQAHWLELFRGDPRGRNPYGPSALPDLYHQLTDRVISFDELYNGWLGAYPAFRTNSPPMKILAANGENNAVPRDACPGQFSSSQITALKSRYYSSDSEFVLAAAIWERKGYFRRADISMCMLAAATNKALSSLDKDPYGELEISLASKVLADMADEETRYSITSNQMARLSDQSEQLKLSLLSQLIAAYVDELYNAAFNG